MEIIRLFIDFAFVILIWIIQIIIYPSMNKIRGRSFFEWHNSYTKQISFFIAPLLFVQSICILFQAIFNFDGLLIFDICLLILAWVYTFLVINPVHNQLNFSNQRTLNVNKLIQVNRMRAAAWSLLFLNSAIRFLWI